MSVEPAVRDGERETTDLSVLNLVSNDKSVFFDNQIDALAGRGVESTVLGVPGDNKSANIHEDENGTRSIYHYLRFVPTVVRESFGGYDLVHANYGLTAPAALAQPTLPTVLSLWGSDLMGEFGWLTRRCVAHIDEVIVMSERMAAELDRDCHVIPHGVDLDLFAPEPRCRARKRLGWEEGTGHVIFPYPPGREVKNYPRAKRVVEAARERTSVPVTFHTVTDADHGEMPAYMNAADVLLLTSKREGSPNTVKEAMACNLPVVATDVGDVPERLAGVTPSTCGHTDRELVDGLVRALEAGDRSNGREYARDLSLDRMADRIRDVYRLALEDAT